MTSDTITALATIIAALATITIAWFTYRQLKLKESFIPLEEHERSLRERALKIDEQLENASLEQRKILKREKRTIDEQLLEPGASYKAEKKRYQEAVKIIDYFKNDLSQEQYDKALQLLEAVWKFPRLVRIWDFVD